MKKIFYWVGTGCQIILLAACIVVQYLAATWTECTNFITTLNQQWEQLLPISVIRLGAAIGLVLLAFLFGYILFRRCSGWDLPGKFLLPSTSVFILECLGLAAFFYFGSIKMLLAYYVICLLFVGVVLIQMIKAIVFLYRKPQHRYF